MTTESEERVKDALDVIRRAATEIGVAPADARDAHDWPTLLGLIVDQLVLEPPTSGFDEASDATGISRNAARRAWLALGQADPDVAEVRISSEEADALAFFDAALSLIGDEATVALATTIRSATANIAEELVSSLQFSADRPMASGSSHFETIEFYRPLVAEVLPWLGRTVAASVRQQFADRIPFDWPENDDLLPFDKMTVAAIEPAAPPELRSRSFVGSWESQQGDLERAVKHVGGRLAGTYGTAIVILLDGAIAEGAFIERLADLASVGGSASGIGLTWGRVSQRRGRAFGPVVSTAVRLARRAAPGEILATVDLVEVTSEAKKWEPDGSEVLVGVDGCRDVYRWQRHGALTTES